MQLPIDYNLMAHSLYHPTGDVIQGPPNWFNQDLPVKSMDPLAEAMGKQGIAPIGGIKFTKMPSARDSAQTSFGSPSSATPKYDAMVGKLLGASNAMKRLDSKLTLKQQIQARANQYSAWAKEFGLDGKGINRILGRMEEAGLGPLMSKDQFFFMLAKLKQDGEL